jgi:uncharacterized membrane protein affecting hemolysin expression
MNTFDDEPQVMMSLSDFHTESSLMDHTEMTEAIKVLVIFMLGIITPQLIMWYLRRHKKPTEEEKITEINHKFAVLQQQ